MAAAGTPEAAPVNAASPAPLARPISPLAAALAAAPQTGEPPREEAGRSQRPAPRPASAASSGGGDLTCAICLDQIPLVSMNGARGACGQARTKGAGREREKGDKKGARAAPHDAAPPFFFFFFFSSHAGFPFFPPPYSSPTQPDLASLPGCDHVYCVACILAWAVARTGDADPARPHPPAPCPQCKAPFTALITHRSLDGTLSDLPSREAVCLLARARWFAGPHAASVAAAAAHAAARPGPPSPPLSPRWTRGQAGGGGGSPARPPPRRLWGADDAAGSDGDAPPSDSDDDAFYFSPAAGRARVILGNRRWGEHGYVAAGRLRARPVVSGGGGGKGKKGKGGAAAPQPPPQPVSFPAGKGKGPAAPAASTPIPIGKGKAPAAPACAAVAAAAALSGSFPSGASPSSWGGSVEKGRRAKRAERRAAEAQAVAPSRPVAPPAAVAPAGFSEGTGAAV